MSADLWNDDLIQFARLIAEMEAFGVFEGLDNWHGLFESMDLDEEAICELIDRAQAVFEKSKARLPGAPDPVVGDEVLIYIPDTPRLHDRIGYVVSTPEMNENNLYGVRVMDGICHLYRFELLFPL